MTDLLSLADLIDEGGKEKAKAKAKSTATPKAKASPISVGSPAIYPSYGTSGILIVGECPTQDDVTNQRPFSGAYSHFVRTLLTEGGVDIRSATCTYAIARCAPRGDPSMYVHAQGKKVTVALGADVHFANVKALIERDRPSLIIAMGNVALYALTGETGITKWRGSQLFYQTQDETLIRLMPIISPATAKKNYADTYLIKHDLRRALNDDAWVIPDYNFIVSPDYTRVMGTIADLRSRVEARPTRLAVDLETRSGHIACCGIGWSNVDAICIPFMKKFNPQGYWTPLEERNIILALRELFLHPNALIETQNGSYDVQYWFRWWHCFALPDFDTMVAHHVCWSGMKKSLDFISSLYCRYHRYWKDDGRNFDLEHHDETRLWKYNCIDCVTTFECATALRDLVVKFSLVEQNEFQTKHNLRTVIRMMLRGVKRDDAAQFNLRWVLQDAANERMALVERHVGRPINPKSPKQISELFYRELGQDIIVNRKTKKPTTNDEALSKIGHRTPLLKPVCNAILDYRSIGVLSSTFVGMRPDMDGRLRCSYNVAGTETYRYSSSENAFGSGGNLQNIPNPDKSKGAERFQAPNVKRMFIPDEGYEIADFDLDRADLQVVVWEANEEPLKALLRAKVDLHLANAQILFNLPFSIEDLKDPELLKRIKKKYGPHRDFAKAFVHGTNYGGSARTMAAAAHCSVMESESAQSKWFSTYPGIKDWHRRVEDQLARERCVWNAFGFRRYYFDRVEALLPEALAWVPQSTVAIVIDKGIINVDENLVQEKCFPLLQVHDSGVFQYPASDRIACLEKIRKQMEIVIPYDDPLLIPVGAKISGKSWGDCADWDFGKRVMAA
jgi:uracil-DNA glycosylase family 4